MALGPGISIAIDEKRFDSGHAPLFENLALTIAPSSVVALVGPSGVGKSTLLRMIAGVDTDYVGEVAIGGVPAAEAPPAGYVFQDPRLLPWLTAVENIRAVRPSITRQEAVDALRQVGLESYENAYPHQLSGGMQRRVALARAFSVNPGLLLLDEPFVSLDRTLIAEMQEVIRDLLSRGERTVVLVTHLAEDAAMLADRAVVLGGRPVRIVADVPFAQPRPARTAADVAAITAEIAQLQNQPRPGA